MDAEDKIYSSIVIRSQAETIELLEKENKKLEKQLEEYKLITIDYQELEARNKDYETRQNEFKKYLEKRLKDATHVLGSYGSNTGNLHGRIEMIKEILSKYKKIVGDK